MEEIISKDVLDSINKQIEKENAFARWVRKNYAKGVETLSDGDRERYLREFETLGDKQ